MLPLRELFAGFLAGDGQPVVVGNNFLNKVDDLRESVSSLSDDQLRTESLELRDRVVATPRSLDDQVPMAMAIVSEAAHRALGVEFFPEQLIAAWSLMQHQIVEMKTGEGKTFVGVMAGYANALCGRGVHIMTTNAYLAERDREVADVIVKRLGLRVGLLCRTDSAEAKTRAYQCDITYGPGYEFGFDYLRDQLNLIQQRRLELGEQVQLQSRGTPPQVAARVQRDHFCAIIDEADSVMIDEASTPLILSGAAGQPANDTAPYLQAKTVASDLVESEHFTIDTEKRQIALTRSGHEWIARKIDAECRTQLRRSWHAYVQQALQAKLHFSRDADYIVSDDQIKIVDKNTGRIFDDRTWSDGLHQAVEAKEAVTITEENQVLARISRQQYFRLYRNIAGMTGTAHDATREFKEAYRLGVTVLPTHKPCRRELLPTRVFATDADKWDAIAQSVREIHATGRPVLVGSRTIAKSEALLDRIQDLDCQLLNGKQDAQEAQIIEDAGQRGSITIATNLAGRGTDIKLAQGVADLGGLHVIISEPHDSVRVDRQLAGRASRQGDPGSAQTFASADDDLLVQHAPWMSRYIRRLARTAEVVGIDLQPEIAKLQISVEAKMSMRRKEMSSREHWLEDVLASLTCQ